MDLDTNVMAADSRQLQLLLTEGLGVVRQFDRLIDSYVLDFYVDDHWNKLPSSWKSCFHTLDPKVFSELLCPVSKTTIVWPLSLIAVKVLSKKICVSREPAATIGTDDVEMECIRLSKLRNVLTKGVKSKKLHEIENMAKICYKSAKITSTRFVVDFGAGLGHLARRLAYGHGLRVCCLEMQDELNKQASIIDQQIEERTRKFSRTECTIDFKTPVHVTIKLTKDVTAHTFLKSIRKAFDLEDCDDFTFGIIGLHPCGDLGAILMNLFLQCNEAKYLNIIGCCYMKLSTNPNLWEYRGYPLSQFLLINSEQFYRLSYESREIACHAIEHYHQRLHCGNYENLKVHSYRAALEVIIVKHWPHLKHSGLKSIKHTSTLTFEEYSKNAVEHLHVLIPDEDVHSDVTLRNLNQWKNIVIYYTLRLLFAPIIESILLYDRLLYLKEKGSEATIVAIFDPFVSPRNHITTATKR